MSEPEAHRLLKQETMFSVIPLRLGVFLLSVCTFATSLGYCIDRHAWHSVFRHFEGGYFPSSWVIVGAMQISGVVAGLSGVIGTWHVKASRIRICNIWQYLRIIGVAVTYYFDLPLLRDCEGYVNTVERMTEEYGWNDLLFQIALRGRCAWERQLFLVCAFVYLVILMYVAQSTSRSLDLVERVLSARQVRANDLSSGAHDAHSTGESSRLDGAFFAA